MLRLVIKAQQLGLFGAGSASTGLRKPVQRPGSRGGRWYSSEQGEIRYGEKPAPTAPTPPPAATPPPTPTPAGAFRYWNDPLTRTMNQVRIVKPSGESSTTQALLARAKRLSASEGNANDSAELKNIRKEATASVIDKVRWEPGFSDARHAVVAQMLDHVLRAMPVVAVATLADNASDIHFYPSIDAVSEAWFAAYDKLHDKPDVNRDAKCLGFVDAVEKLRRGGPPQQIIHIGDSFGHPDYEESTAGTIAHEIGHVLDGPLVNRLSKKYEWEKIYYAEVYAKLSQYADTSPVEGFAELHRFFVANPSRGGTPFPRAFAFFRKEGFV